MNAIKLGSLELGGSSLFLISGPCVIEDEDKGAGFTLDIARSLKEVTTELGIPFIFKASFDKANRTSHKSFRGPGLEKGLEILAAIKEELQVPILTDIHGVDQVEPASKVADILQIPAFLCRQTDLLQETARHAKVINIKKGQFLAPWDVENAVEKARSQGQKNITITERGASFGYNNLVSDMRAIPLMRKFGHPVIFDATHSVQLPGGQGSVTGGMPEMIAPLCRAAVATGCDGLFVECHPDPSQARSDGSNALVLDQLKPILEVALELRKVVQPLL